MKDLFFIAAMILSLAFAFTACDGGNASKEKSTTVTDKKEQLGKDEMYTCTMHNDVMSDHTGECPKCGMTLEKKMMTAEQQKMMNEGTYTKPNK